MDPADVAVIALLTVGAGTLVAWSARRGATLGGGILVGAGLIVVALVAAVRGRRGPPAG